jgi:hypothetical protein
VRVLVREGERAGGLPAAVEVATGDLAYVDAGAVRDTLAGFGLDAWFVDALVGLYQDYRRSGVDGYAAQISDTVTRPSMPP